MITVSLPAIPADAGTDTTRFPTSSIRQAHPHSPARSITYWRTACSCFEGRGICVML